MDGFESKPHSNVTLFKQHRVIHICSDSRLQCNIFAERLGGEERHTSPQNLISRFSLPYLHDVRPYELAVARKLIISMRQKREM